MDLKLKVEKLLFCPAFFKTNDFVKASNHKQK